MFLIFCHSPTRKASPLGQLHSSAFLPLFKSLIHSSMTSHVQSVTRPASCRVPAMLPSLFLHMSPGLETSSLGLHHINTSSGGRPAFLTHCFTKTLQCPSARHKDLSGTWPLPSIQPDLLGDSLQGPSPPTSTT